MFINAGKAYTNRFAKKAPVHVSITDPDEYGVESVRSLCGGIPISPIKDQGQVLVTCRTCQQLVEQLALS